MRLFLCLAISILLVGNAYALLDDNSTNQDQQQGQIGIKDFESTNFYPPFYYLNFFKGQIGIKDFENINCNDNRNTNDDLRSKISGGKKHERVDTAIWGNTGNVNN